MGRQHHRWTPEEKQFLRDNIAGSPYAELREMFNKRFGIPLSEKAFTKAIYNNNAHNGLFRESIPIGGTYTAHGGYVKIKTGKGTHGWKLKHHIIWEAVNGRPVPKGHAVIFADGDKSNFAPDNLLLVSRVELGYMNHNGLRFPDRNLTRAGHALAALKLATVERGRELGIGRPKRAKKQGADRYDDGTETEAANRRGAGNNPAGKEAAV